MPFADDYHTPVMVSEVCDALIWDPDGVYVDCTLGGGGHSMAILELLKASGGTGKLLAVGKFFLCDAHG
jgi:16S rRNA C1402 N4-methylase RsmH